MVRRRGAVGVWLSCSFGLAGCAEPPASGDPYLEAAVAAGRWLQSVPADSSGRLPDRLDQAGSSAGVGSGAAGRAIFFAELFAATGDSSFQRWAATEITTALDAARSDSVGDGLYNGRPGVAAAAAEVGRVLADGVLRDRARALFLAIAGSGASSDGVHDVLGGRAGTGLALLYAFEQFGDTILLEASVRRADELLEAAVPGPEGGWRWLRGSDTPFDLPNFSHGTAGVGYLMARLAQVSSHARFRDAALAAAAYLDAIADRRDGLYLVPYGVPNDGYATPYDIGWAHGSAGTARFHYALSSLNEPARMHNLVDAQVRSLFASGLPGASRDGELWVGPFPIDRRFGTAGAAAFLADWSRIANPDPLVLAREVADDILARATSGPAGIYWRVAPYGFQGAGEPTVFTGFSYGSAGFGLTLLHVHAAAVGAWPAIRLPDDPFPRRDVGGDRR